MKLLLLSVFMITVVTINCRGHRKPPKVEPTMEFQQGTSLRPEFTIKPRNDSKPSSKTSRDNGLGAPISAEEITAAIANSNLTKPHPGEDHSEENSGEFEGDIILTPEQQAQMEMGVRSASLYQKWENGIIPYTISSVFTTDERQVIARAIAEFEAKTCIKFVGRTQENDYIEIYSGDGCSSFIGRTGGKQLLSLRKPENEGDSHCVFVGVAIHEFMHASGFFHEQSRYDRDEYVTIHWENIEKLAHNFAKQTTSTTIDLGLRYDYSSVMHYGTHYFSKNDEPTITPKKAGVTIGQRDGFSKLDLLGLNLLYNCGGCVGGVIIAGQCLLFSSERLTWNAAKEKCSSQYGRLASLNDPQAFKDYVLSKYGNELYWLGGSDKANEGSWFWQNGQPLGVQFPWNQGEPNDYGGSEDCLEYFQWGSHSSFNDAPCDRQYKYVCEKGCVGGVIIEGQCLHISIEKLSWNAAKEKCSSQNGRLASLNDPQAFNTYVASTYDNELIWLGGSDKANEGSWVWQNGQQLGDQFPWNQGEPNNYGGSEDCLEYFQGGSHNSFNDAPCDRQYKYVCEKGCVGGVLIAGQCLTFSTEALSWNDAKERCSSQKGRLALLQDPQAFQNYAAVNYGSACSNKNDNCQYWANRNECEKNPKYMLYYCAQSCNSCAGERFWLGGSDTANEGSWTWLDGRPMNNFPWMYWQADNERNQDCLMWGWRNNFDDNWCSRKYRYICELTVE